MEGSLQRLVDGPDEVHKGLIAKLELQKRGVIAASAGNHAQGVALAARYVGTGATIVLPEFAPLTKVNATRGFAGPWVMLPGNHDAALSESVWTRAQRLNAVPDHVHLCLRPVPLHFEGLNAVVLPAPLTQRHTYTDLTEWFAAADRPTDANGAGDADAERSEDDPDHEGEVEVEEGGQQRGGMAGLKE